MLEAATQEAISKLVEKLATSGKEEINKKLFRELVVQAGKDEEHIAFLLKRMFHHLEQGHSEIRLGAVLLVDQLFRRSRLFRELLLNDIHNFLELTVESNPTKLLPPPIAAAKTLKMKTLQAIHKWYSMFGEENKRLSLSYNFLKNSLKIDFDDALARNARELQRDRQEEERQRRVMAEKTSAVEAELAECEEEIVRITTEMENCFCLLIPRPDHAFGDTSFDADDRNEESVDLRAHGIRHTIAITAPQNFLEDDLRKVEETEDNAVLIENLRDMEAVLNNRFLPKIKKWVAIVSKCENQPLFRKLMELRSRVEQQLHRFSQIKITKKAASQKMECDSSSDSCDDDDSDFEEVPEKEGYEAEAISTPVVAVDPKPGCSKKVAAEESTDSGGWKLLDFKKDDVHDPTSLLATLKTLQKSKRTETDQYSTVPPARKMFPNLSAPATIVKEPVIDSQKPEESSSRKQKLLKVAPKIPFDIDLYHWEDTDLKAPSVEIVETDGHKFWTPTQDREGEVIENPDGVATLRTRVIEYSGTFEPVKWSCRAPLPSGTLCPRKDRVKCPLHGKIIARDNMGNPTNPADIAELEAAKEKEEQSKPPEWQDPEFLKEIEAATGMDLTVRPPKKGAKKKKTFAEMYPGLTDIDKRRNNPRTRLEKKVFNRGTMKRIGQKLDEIHSKKIHDKFGDQWNYSMASDD